MKVIVVDFGAEGPRVFSYDEELTLEQNIRKVPPAIELEDLEWNWTWDFSTADADGLDDPVAYGRSVPGRVIRVYVREVEDAG